MAVLEGSTSGALAGVAGETSSPLHTVPLPMSYGAGGWYRAGQSSGTIAAALAANSEIYQFRYVTARSQIALVYKVTISAGANVAATAAALASFRMTAARAWTGAGTGGNRLILTGENCSLRTAMATSEVNDAGISSTGSLAAGTKTLDTTDLGSISFGIGTGALTTAANLNLLDQTPLFDATGEGHSPLILANQEGFVVRTGNAFPATMTWAFSVNVLWAEVPAF